MGTLSKRRLEDFGADVRDRIENFRSSVGGKLDNLSAGAKSASRHEGTMTRALERVTAALPSTTWLALAGAAFVGSVALQGARRKHEALYVGLLVPSFLLLGVYNKLVKVVGSERDDDHGMH
jgi:hypothetical protein